MKVKIIILLITAYLSIPVTGYSYRPFGTEDAGVAGKKVFQSEFSYDYLKWTDGSTDNVFLLVPIYGITERIEFSAEFPYTIHSGEDGESHEGMSDVNLVLKALLFEEGGLNPAFTLKCLYKTDSGDEERGLGSGTKDFSIIAVASKVIGNFYLHSQVGWTFISNGDESTRKGLYNFGLAIDYQLIDLFHIAGEINGNRHPDKNERHDPVQVLLGIILKITDSLFFDAGFKKGLNNTAPDAGATVGISVTL